LILIILVFKVGVYVMAVVKRTITFGREEILVIDAMPSGVKDLITTYLYFDENKEAVIIDPGPAASAMGIVRVLREKGLKLKNIFLTHIHLDHAGGCGSLRESVQNFKVYVHPRGAPHLCNPSRLWNASKKVLGEMANLYGEPQPLPCESVVETSDMEEIRFSSTRFLFLHTPGHASHHQSILDRNNSILYPGDSLGMWLESLDAYIPSTPPPFYYEKYVESLEKMQKLRPKWIFFPHTSQIKDGSLFNLHRKQIDDWLEVSKEVLGRYSNADIVSVARAISEVDSNAEKILASGNKHYIELFMSSVEGIIDYLKNREKKQT
jgi:glyoxylase-like metal-dependent hydrolase (beta-lactamase superfamily II)